MPLSASIGRFPHKATITRPSGETIIAWKPARPLSVDPQSSGGSIPAVN